MSGSSDVISRINAKYPVMSKRQRLLADYIKAKADKAAYLTAAKMGKNVGVSESTVVRFAAFLGYKGYPEFQKALEEMVRSRMNSIQRIEAASGRMTKSGLLKDVLLSDADKIRKTADDINQQVFDAAVDTILSSKKIYVIGVRSCAPLASFLSYYLNLMFEDVHQMITSTSSELFEQMVRLNENDVVIGISFPRYSKRTLKALAFAKTRGAKVISITDSENAPINQYADHCLIAYSDMATIVDSLVAPLSLINALLAVLCMKRQNQVEDTFTELERIWGEYQVYEDSEIDDLHERRSENMEFKDF